MSATTYYQRNKDIMLNRAKDYYENNKDWEIKQKINIETYPKKKKTKRENKKKTPPDIIVCLRKRNRN